MENTTKVCRKCGSEKPITEFRQNKSAGYKDGRETQCKDCRRVFFRERARLSKERPVNEPAAIAEKQCTKCGLVKPIGGFKKNPLYRDGYYGWCRECRQVYRKKAIEKDPTYFKRQYQKRKASGNMRDYHLRYYFGITLVQYNEMLAAQGGGCAVCGKGPGKKSLAVDHDHKTGKIRGLLCRGCNTALGHVEEDIERMRKLIEYLGKHLVIESLVPG